MSVLLDISRSSPRPPEMESEIEIDFPFGESSHRKEWISFPTGCPEIHPSLIWVILSQR